MVYRQRPPPPPRRGRFRRRKIRFFRWQNEFLQNPYDITGNLGGTSPTFSNTSDTGIRDYLYTGVGFTVELGKKWNTSFFYNAAAGNSDLTSQNIFWSAGIMF